MNGESSYCLAFLFTNSFFSANTGFVDWIVEWSRSPNTCAILPYMEDWLEWTGLKRCHEIIMLEYSKNHSQLIRAIFTICNQHWINSWNAGKQGIRASGSIFYWNNKGIWWKLQSFLKVMDTTCCMLKPDFEVGKMLPNHETILRARLALRFKNVFYKIWIFFFFELICFWCFQIILMCWTQKWFLKNKKNIIGIFFWVKNTLKNNNNHTPKHSLRKDFDLSPLLRKPITMP